MSNKAAVALGVTVIGVAAAVFVLTMGAAAVGPLIVLSVLVGAGLIILLIVAGRRATLRLRLEFDEEAQRLGLRRCNRLRHKNPLVRRFASHPHLKVKGARINDPFRGSLPDGSRINFYTHAYVIPAGQVTIPVTHRVVMMRVPRDWPALRIAPRRVGWLRRWFPPRVELERDTFHQRYVLECDDEDFALALLNPDMQDWLIELDPIGDWTVENGRLAYLESGSMRRQDLARLVERLEMFRALVAEELWTRPQPPLAPGSAGG